ncbi:bromodomain-containing protein 8-like [Uloborus diversus]|uniref:bromodomain-containing protein 8-like n=1 Tax=Uloborus diversus TaxID=327109 RepID=UPI00240A7B8D|nr:bromodomain-containing protein 8-like [Uloborus diversus]
MSFAENVSIKENEYLSRLEVDDEDGNEYTDKWSTNELLYLASAVGRSGDKNWVSVSRSIKLFSDLKRPSDWYIPKNCALQYTKLLKGVEDYKKKSLPRTERETSEELLLKNLTDKRLLELSWLNQQMKSTASSLKTYMDMLENGELDDNLDDMMKQIEDLEKREDEGMKEWLSKRESLNAAKRLNKRRVPLNMSRTPTKLFDSKRKNSPGRDMSDDAALHKATIDAIKTEIIDPEYEIPSITKNVPIKQEIIDSSPSLNALLDKPTTISPKAQTTPTSPLLTSLLRNVASSSPGSLITATITSPLKEFDASELLERSKLSVSMSEKEAGIVKTKESPRSTMQQNNRPTPASSPLLNSLLKNTPSTTTTLPVQLLNPKDANVAKVVSSPQSFFNPSSALATAAAQQLAVATSTLPQGHQFFQNDLGDKLLSPPVSSACTSAPTLSKLLEMPPSTPGRLPPLPIIDAPSCTSTPILTPTEANTSKLLPKGNEIKLESILDLPLSSSPQKNIILDNVLEHISFPEVSPSSSTGAFQPFDVKNEIVIDGSKNTTVESKACRLGLPELDVTSQENIDIIQAVCENYNVIDVKDMKQEPMDVDLLQSISFQSNESLQSTSPTLKNSIRIEKCMSEDSDISVEKLVSSIEVREEDNIFASVDLKETSELLLCDDDLPKKIDIDTCDNSISNICADLAEKSVELEEDRGQTSRKFYKSRMPSRKSISADEDPLESISETIALISPAQTAKKVSNEPLVETSACMDTSPPQSIPETKVTVKVEAKSPAAKKPRLFEKTTPTKDKKELSEDETTPSARRSGRRAKKGRGKSNLKALPVKPDPKDQYEFSESTEENSVGYQAANTLCYMPRIKDDGKIEDVKKLNEDSEDSRATTLESPVEKNFFSTPLRKQAKPSTTSPSSGRRNLFPSDEERMSDSLTSDEASNPTLGEEGLKKWRESSEKRDDTTKELDDSQQPSKHTESPKRKTQNKRSSPVKADSPPKKVEKKVPSSDVEESSVCSRDSEDISNNATWCREDAESSDVKDSNIASVDMEAEADSRMSLSVTTESEKQMDDVEGCESLPGSVMTEFSPLPSNDAKEDKDVSQSGKRDWYPGSSPKSSEPVSQSSEESEDSESDTWENQQNKGSSRSTGQRSRVKRKEKESPQYKAWKKAIHIVLSEASAHKYANIFLHKVTNDVAPGYHSVVNRPMDLSLIKKNVDNGVITTTEEFHRDMMLMFQNAIMYNNRNHAVYRVAVEMQRDVIHQIQAFLTTQANDKEESVETSLRGARTAKAQKGYSSALKPKDEAE